MAEPNWSDFRVLLALGEAGSVAGAARLLDVDGSTVSRRLAAAEAAFGAVLIVRGGGDFAFTAEGKAALRAARAMEAAVTEARASVRAARAGLEGVVRIACVPTAMHFLRGFGDLVAERHPGLEVELLSARGVMDLARGDADIAIRTARPTDLDLVVAHTFTWGSALYAAPAYLDRHGHPAIPADLRDHKLVRYGTGLTHLCAFGWIEAFADPAAPAQRVENSDSARVMIEAGAGIGPLFCAVGDTCPGLVRVFPDPFDQIDSWIVYHESARGSARMRAVLDLLVGWHIERRALVAGIAAAG